MSGLQMTVSTYPNSDLDLKEDIELIKIALLYSDSVTLKSVKADLVYRVLDYKKQKSFLDKMYYMRDIAHLAKANLESDIEDLIYKFRKMTNKRLDGRMTELLKLQSEFKPTWSLIEQAVLESINIDGVNSIEKLISSNRLEMVRYNTDTKKFHNDDDYIMEYLRSIESTLSQHNNYPLFDSEISNLVNLGIRDGVLKATSGTQERIKHSNLTLTMLKNLPSFEKAEIDEIIDIRSDLEKYLIRFRSAIVKYTDLVESDVTDEDLLYEIDKLIIKEINPAIQDIDEQCKENKYLRELGYTLVNSKWVQAACVGLILGNVFDVFTANTSAATGAITTGTGVLNHHKRWRENKARIEQHNLFFYYQAG